MATANKKDKHCSRLIKTLMICFVFVTVCFYTAHAQILPTQQIQSMDNTSNLLASQISDSVSSSKENSASSSVHAAPGTKIGQMQKGRADISVVFNVRNSAQLNKFIADSQKQAKGQEPILSEQEFEANYSPTQSDYNSVVTFLSSENISVTQTYSNRLLLIGQGSPADVQNAFGTQIDLFSYANTTFYKSDSGITIPDSLNTCGIAGIAINNFTLTPSLAKASEITSNGIGPDNLAFNSSPDDFRDAYGTSGVIQDGWTGNGTKIGIVDAYGDSSIRSDVSLFDTHFNLPSLALTVSGIGGSNSNWAKETALDVEWAHAMSPGAAILLRVSSDNSNTNLFSAVNNLVQMQNPPNIISLSWGEPEFSTAYASIFQAAAAKGIKVYVSTGDNGAFDSQSSLTVEYPASDPNVIAVGGTTLYCNTVQGTNEHYENGWSESGGGYSSIFSEPSYQTTAGIPDPSRRRAIPDVSLDADPYSGVTIYVGGSEETGWGGTSLAAPMMAGISAVALNGGWNLNNNVLYSNYASNDKYQVAFHDVYISGNNGYYNVTHGWDAVTGLGSINFQNFANIFHEPQGVTLTDYTLSPNIIKAGQSLTLTYSINNPDTNYSLTQIGLGATIRLHGTKNETSDASNDLCISILGGLNTQTRQFHANSFLSDGYYDVMWSVWMGPPSLGNSLFSSSWQMNQLRVVSQYQVTFDYQVSGGGSPSAPLVTFTSHGSQSSITAGPTATVWADYDSTYTYTPNPLTGSTGNERWQASNGTSGTISSPTTISPTYYHQYQVTLSYSTSDSSTPSSSAPLLIGTQFSSSSQVPLTVANQTVWLDENTQWHLTNVTAFLSTSDLTIPSPTPAPQRSPPTLSISSPSNSTYTQGSPIPLTLVYNHSNVDSTYGFPVFWNVLNNATDDWVYAAGETGIEMADQPYNVTGISSSFNIDLNTYDNQSLPAGEYTVYAYAGNQYGLTGPIAVTFIISPPTERWICSANNFGTITGATSINPTYNHQYALKVTSPYGSSGSGWYNAGTAANFAVTSPVSVASGEQNAFASWTGSGSGSYNGSDAAGSCTMNAPVTEIASWNTQYYLTVTSPYGSPTGAGWYNAGATATFDVITPFSGNAGTQYLLSFWSGLGTGSYNGSTASNSVTLDNAITEAANWTTQYLLTFIVIPSGGGSTELTGNTFWADAGPLSISLTTNSGYTFSQWTANTVSITFDNSNARYATADVNGPGTITASLTQNLPQTTSPTPAPTLSPTQAPTPAPSQAPTQSPIQNTNPTPAPAPEYPSVLSLAVILLLVTTATLLYFRKNKHKSIKM